MIHKENLVTNECLVHFPIIDITSIEIGCLLIVAIEGTNQRSLIGEHERIVVIRGLQT